MESPLSPSASVFPVSSSSSSSGEGSWSSSQGNDIVRVSSDSYRIINTLGEGSFGKLFEAVDIVTNETVALKVESDAALANSKRRSFLRKENEILRELQGIPGIPKWKNYGEIYGQRFLVMEKLGPSLERLYEVCKGFSLKTVLMVGIQLLQQIEHVHNRNILHRDLKPANIVVGVGANAKQIYLIDFGLSKIFRHPNSLAHIPERTGCGVVGTSRYVSCLGHSGHELSRKDDIESIAYILIYFLKGSLPWQGRIHENEPEYQRIERVKQMKMLLPISELCQGLPLVFHTLVLYCRNLHFEEVPDYSYLKQLLGKAMNDHYYHLDNQFDWLPMFPASTPEYCLTNVDYRNVAAWRPPPSATDSFIRRETFINRNNYTIPVIQPQSNQNHIPLRSDRQQEEDDASVVIVGPGATTHASSNPEFTHVQISYRPFGQPPPITNVNMNFCQQQQQQKSFCRCHAELYANMNLYGSFEFGQSSSHRFICYCGGEGGIGCYFCKCR